ncbi:SubName: Full=Related to RIB7-HTP reductase {ECO:0000313/EMBL:CCA70414.1} [Serendipita indica DSM 11827]|nr:SubName: Full=Related to RIB7-HTP reductase {ECO:0000313/EMBL:CCA70414.1} [Serendipita indica DSM 11827]
MDELDFLRSVLPLDHDQSRLSVKEGFWTTVTFAQSLNGCIAGPNGTQLILSGKQSMIMTHWMRSMHDAILVGINTVLNDDPQLNTRHLPPREGGYQLPLPIVLDTHLRMPLDCKLIRNASSGIGKYPLVFCTQALQDDIRKRTLQDLGVKVIPVELGSDGRIPMSTVVETLRQLGLHSLMVEGGASVLSSCLSSARDKLRIDRIIVTIANCVAPGNGTHYDISAQMTRLSLHTVTTLGGDIVAAYDLPGNS